MQNGEMKRKNESKLKKEERANTSKQNTKSILFVLFFSYCLRDVYITDIPFFVLFDTQKNVK